MSNRDERGRFNGGENHYAKRRRISEKLLTDIAEAEAARLFKDLLLIAYESNNESMRFKAINTALSYLILKPQLNEPQDHQGIHFMDLEKIGMSSAMLNEIYAMQEEISRKIETVKQ